jgi:hypothetical protein
MAKKLSRLIAQKIEKAILDDKVISPSVQNTTHLVKLMIEASSVNGICDLKKMNRCLNRYIKFGEEFNKSIKKNSKKFYKKVA